MARPPLPNARARTSTLPPPLPAAARRSGTLVVPPLPLPAQTIALAPRRSQTMRAASEPDLAPAKLVAFLPPPEPTAERTPTMPRPALIDEEPHVARAPLPSFDIDIDTDSDTDDDDDPIDPPRPLEYTTAAPKKSNTGMWIGAGVGASLIAGVLAVTLIGRSGPDVATSAPPPSPPAVPAQVTAPALAPLKQTPQTEVPIRSQPSGAMVTLISAGEATVIGKTPITASLDPRKQYDVVLAYRELPTKLAHVDPERTVALDIDLMGAAPPVPQVAAPAAPEPTETAAPAEEAPPPEPAPVKRKSAKPKAVAIAETPKPAAPKPAAPKPAAPAPKTVAAVPAAGSGVLMVSAKPPCNIAIDGKATRLVTPQRSIPLPAGPHKITLTNTQARISKTLNVTITAGKPTKLIQDFTANVVDPF